MLRALVDSMIFDRIAAEPALLEAVDRLTSSGALQLLADTASVEQVAATPDLEHRARLRRVRVLVVPPAEGGDPVLRALAARPGVDVADAGIAAAARAQGVPLVTEDADLRRAAEAVVPDLVLWTWALDLHPKLTALMAEIPPRRRW